MKRKEKMKDEVEKVNRGFIMTVCLAGSILLLGCTEKTVTAPKNQAAGYDKYVVLGEYKGIQIDKVEITDEDVRNEISRMLEDNADVSPVTNRAAQIGDMVNIDYVGTKDGTAFENGSYQNQFLELGEGTFIDGFEEGVIGMMPGEQKSISVTFPSDYWDPSMAGQQADFLITLNYIEQVNSIPEYTDELVVTLTNGDLKTTQEYTDWLRKQMELDALNYRRSQLMGAVLSTCQFAEVPQERVDAMYQEITDYYTNIAQQHFGETLEEYAVNSGMTLEEMQNRFMQQASASVQQTLVALAIGEREGIQITDIECEDMANEYGYQGFAEMTGMYGESRAREILLVDKVIDELLISE